MLAHSRRDIFDLRSGKPGSEPTGRAVGVRRSGSAFVRHLSKRFVSKRFGSSHPDFLAVSLCTKGYLPSNEVEPLCGSGQFVPELRMTEADHRIGALGR